MLCVRVLQFVIEGAEHPLYLCYREIAPYEVLREHHSVVIYPYITGVVIASEAEVLVVLLIDEHEHRVFLALLSCRRILLVIDIHSCFNKIS